MNINVIQNEDKYFISFPYDQNVVNMVKAVPGRWYYPDNHQWSIPEDRLGFFISQVKGTAYEPYLNIVSNNDIDKDATLDTTLTIPDIDITDAVSCLRSSCKLFKHQEDFLKWSIGREANGNMHGFLLADTMGLGKTLQASALAVYNKKKYGFKHCLVIVCMNSAKYNWQEDIEKFTKEKAYILGTRFYARKSMAGQTHIEGGKAKYEDLMTMTRYGNTATSEKDKKMPYFIIMNIEAIRYGEKRKHLMMEAITQKIKEGEIGMIAVDEIHRNASMHSQNGKLLLQVKKNTEDKCMWLPMTGTPITSKPLDLFLPLKLIDGTAENSFWRWSQHYCVYGGFGGHEIVGYQRMPELQHILQPNMIRRKKEDVLDLPEKIHITEYVENTPFQEKLYNAIVADLLANKDTVMQSLNPMAKMLRLRQVNGTPELVVGPEGEHYTDYKDSDYLSKNARLQRFLELVQDIVDNDEKIIVFSNWVEPLRMLYYYLINKLHIKTAVYTGTMSQEDREKQKERFLKKDDVKIFLGTIGAAGVSHTLTVANHVIFYDDPWNPATKSQAEDRAHRISQKNTVTVHTLVTKGTIDERVEKILEKKQGISDFMIDGELDMVRHPELYDLLLS